MARNRSVQPHPFGVRIERRPTAVYLRLSGEFDITATADFEEAVREIELQGSNQVVIDLRGLSFIDSTGLGAIIDVWRRSSEDGVNVAVLEGPAQVRRTFELTGLDRILPSADGSHQQLDA